MPVYNFHGMLFQISLKGHEAEPILSIGIEGFIDQHCSLVGWDISLQGDKAVLS